MTQFGNQMPTGLLDPLQGIMVAKGSIIDKVHDLDVITYQLQQAPDFSVSLSGGPTTQENRMRAMKVFEI